MKHPEIRINFSWIFYEDVSRKIHKYKEWELPSDESCEEWTDLYRRYWLKSENTVLGALSEITGLEFYKDVIDITTAPGVISKSEPLLLNFRSKPDKVADVITHELAHTLLCDNKTLSIYGSDRDYQLGTKWRELFGFEDDFNALVHVPVHAICQIVFEKYLGDKEFVRRDKKLMKELGATSYTKSWDYVENVGAEVVIEKLKKSYTDIAKELEKKK